MKGQGSKSRRYLEGRCSTSEAHQRLLENFRLAAPRTSYTAVSDRVKGDAMNKVMSACGVFCSDCAAYKAASRGSADRQEAADAWKRIYGFQTEPEKMSCGGCLGSDDQVFHTSVRCTARRCCLSKGFHSCAECPEESCELLAKAQSNWDTVPGIGIKLSASDFEKYAQPYCGPRERLEAARRAFRARADVPRDMGRQTQSE